MRRWGALLLLGSLALSGCWDRYETNERSILQAVAVDWQDGRYLVTATVINTRAVPTPGSGTPGPSTPETSTLIGQGSTPAEALADLDHVSSRSLFWPSTEVLIIGEDLARQGIRPFLDTWLRFPKLPLSSRVLVAHGPAEGVLAKRQTGVEISIGRNLRFLAQTLYLDQSSGFAPHFYDLLRWDAEAGRAAMVLGVRPVTPRLPTGPSFQLDTSAVLRGGRLVAWAQRPTVRMTLWLSGRFTRSVFDLPCPSRPGPLGTFRVDESGQRVQPVIQGGAVVAMDVRLSARASLLHAPCAGTSLAALQQAATASVQSEAQQAIAWAQGSGDDILGWGEGVYRRAPALWNQKYAANWPATFAHLPVRLNVRLNLSLSGEAQP